MRPTGKMWNGDLATTTQRGCPTAGLSQHRRQVLRSGYRLGLDFALSLALLCSPLATSAQDASGSRISKPRAKVSRKSTPSPRTTSAVTSTTAADLQATLARYQSLTSAPAGSPLSEQVVATVEKAFVGMFYDQRGQTRYLAVQLKFANPTAAAVTFTRSQVAAKIDGEPFKLESLTAPLIHHGFQYHNEGYRLEQLQPADSWTIPPQGVLTCWMVFADLPMAAGTPSLQISIPLADHTVMVDVNAQQTASLGMQEVRRGPRNCLAIVSLSGYLNNFNLGGLTAKLDALAEAKLSRVILQWTDGSPPPDMQVLQFLNFAAINAGSGRTSNDQFTPLPVTIRELHLTFPENTTVGVNDLNHQSQLGPHLHKSLASAALAALRTAFEVLPNEELVAAIKEGEPLSRSAAIVHGGSRLDVSVLPLLCELTSNPDPTLRDASIIALSHFGNDQAVKQLLEIAGKHDHPGSRQALASLAGSRFGTAHQSLLGWYRSVPQADQIRLLEVLAEYPRPEWRPILLDALAAEPSQWNVAILRALVQLGHPELVSVLERGLAGEKDVREFAFQSLSTRTDQRSETVALQYTLVELEHSPPDAAMIQFLQRVRAPEAIPLLLAALETASDRNSLVVLLAQLGDRKVGDELAKRFATAPVPERPSLLNALRTLRHPRFRPLAGESLLTTDPSLVSTAAEGLRQDGSDEACELLVEALKQQTQAFAVSTIIQTLGQFSGPAAREALIVARESTDQQRRNQAISSLQQMAQRSPAYQFIYQAMSNVREKQWDAAVESYDLAIQLDPELPDAYAGRAQLRLHQEKFAEARQDVDEALRLDPYNAQAITGRALLLVMDGQYEPAFTLLNQHGERNRYDANYEYNTACVYSRALERVLKEADSPERNQQAEKYRKETWKHLRAAVSRGLDEASLPDQDPDLRAVRDDPLFKRILSGEAAEEPAAPAAPEATN